MHSCVISYPMATFVQLDITLTEGHWWSTADAVCILENLLSAIPNTTAKFID